MQTIPTAATAIKEMLAADQAASSQQIDDIISRYLRVRDSAAVEPIENELAAIFASGVDHAARVVAGLELLPRTLTGMGAYHRNKNRAFSEIPPGHASARRFATTARSALLTESAFP